MDLFGRAAPLGNRLPSHAAMRGTATAPDSVAGMPSLSRHRPDDNDPNASHPIRETHHQAGHQTGMFREHLLDITTLMGPDIIKKKPPKIRKTIPDGPRAPRKRPSRTVAADHGQGNDALRSKRSER